MPAGTSTSGGIGADGGTNGSALLGGDGAETDGGGGGGGYYGGGGGRRANGSGGGSGFTSGPGFVLGAYQNGNNITTFVNPPATVGPPATNSPYYSTGIGSGVAGGNGGNGKVVIYW